MDTREDSVRLLREATEDLNRAIRYADLQDWLTVVLYAQLAIEKAAKALIACFEAFAWTHDPSDQLRRLIRDGALPETLERIADNARRAAVWHGRAIYGSLVDGKWRSPSEVCTEDVARELLAWAMESVERATAFLGGFWGL
ncbi:MAG: HEPN domain-containing protein [Anaerolineae bacterium]